MRGSLAVKIEYQPNLHFLDTGRFCLAPLSITALGAEPSSTVQERRRMFETSSHSL